VGRFNSIKKSRKKSKDIDEKIEYLNKECQKTGLQEVMTTSSIYVSTKEVPNTSYTDFQNISIGGYTLGLSGADGNGAGGAIIGTNSNGVKGAALSPPHPITGERTYATHVLDGVGSTTPLRPGVSVYRGFSNKTLQTMGGALWFFDSTYNFNNAQGRWLNFEWFNGGWGFWDTSFLGFYFHNQNLDQYELNGVNIGTQIKNQIAGINFSNTGAVGTPTTTVFVKDDLGNPGFLPIDIKGISPQAFDYIKDKASGKGTDVASGGVNYDLYNYLHKRYGIGAANWYENNPTKPHGSNPNIPTPEAPYVPLASNPNDPFANEVKPGLGAKPGDQLAFLGGKKPPKTLTKKSDFGAIKKSTATKDANFSIMGMGLSPEAFKKKYGISPQDFLNLPENKTSDKKYLEEGVKLGHFDPEILTVDIEKLRKGIMPDFPKDPPPEMIGGYSAKSRLVRKDPELPPFIKVTKKDLAQNHKLTDKEISDFMNDVKMINDYIKKNPAELIYAMTRYPKDDPRLAQLNFKMDQMKAASDEYIETHFPENQKLFDKLQDKIIRNVKQTDPKNFTGHKEAPKFTDDNSEMNEQRKRIVTKHFKKKVILKKLFRKA
tara:strand:+ start:48 stop:1853 length:1806 start_codon:yes stop_codon:yes gene_type:complete